MRHLNKLAVSALITAAASLPGAAAAQDTDWVGTWTASAQPVWAPDFAVGMGMPGNLWNQTIRQTARVSVGGDRVRFEVSNEYGEFPITIGAAAIALTDDEARIKDGTSHAATFGGDASITIPPGGVVLSDPVDLAVPDLTEVSVSLYFDGVAPTSTLHWDGHQTGYIAGGDQTAAADLPEAQTLTKRVFLTEIMVEADADLPAVILFGDSITDGDGATVDGNDRWGDVLAERLIEAGQPTAIQNQGISGAKVLRDRMGVNGLARFERDVLSQDDAVAVVIMLGINDIGWPGTNLAPNDPMADADEIIAGHKQLIARAQANGLKVIGATLTPFADSFEGTVFDGFYTEEKEAIRQKLNAFIRSGAYDAVIDFDKAVEDPDNPGHILPAYDKGDHLHPNPAGYAAMANAIDLSVLQAD